MLARSSWTRIPFQVILPLLLFSTSINTKEANDPPGSLAVPPLGEPVRRSVVLKGDSHTEPIEVLKPSTYELQCTWAGGNGVKLPNITGFWKRNGKLSELEDSIVDVPLENNQYNLKREFSILGDDTLGTYSCVFDGKARIDFIFAVPQMHDHDKPIVSYVGDSVVLVCKMDEKKPAPVSWQWYKPNGTDKALINSSAEHRYKIKKDPEDPRKSKLVVADVTQSDSGAYHCGAVYEVGISLSRNELKVISFMEPLKPFIAIVIEVIVLVVVILLYERSGKITPGDPEDDPNTEQTNQLTQGENSEASIRQRKV